MGLILNLYAGLGRTAWRWLLQLDEPVPQHTEREFEAEVERHYRWNFAVNVTEGAMFWLGLSFISSSTIVPLFISKLTPSPLVIGLAALIAQSSWYLPQFFVAGPTERLARKKPVVVNLGFFLERVPAWLWPLAAFVALRSPMWALFLFLFGYAWHGLGAGLIGPAWQDMIARCFPVDRRGRFFGLTTFIGTGLGVAGAVFSAWILKTYPFPTNFVYTFLIAAAGINLSWAFIALTREPVQPVEPTPAAADRLRDKLGRILRSDPNFRRYLQARILMALGGMGVGFVTVAAVQRWNVPDSTVGIYTAVMLVGQTTSNLVSGLLADRFGHKLSMQMGVAAALAAFLIAWLAPAPVWYYAVFALLGIALGAAIVSGVLMTLEFAEPGRRPTYVGIANTGVGVASAVAPMLGGWIAGFSYSGLFAASAGVNLAALVLLRWHVGDPRWQRAGAGTPAKTIADAEV